MRLPSIIHHYQLEQLVKLAESAPPGHFVEVGVYMGGSASLLYEVAQRQGRELHLFDTFTGTPVSIEGLDKHLVDKEFAAETTPDLIRAFLPDAHLHIGVYPETHPAELAGVAFVHCDCDQYQSYRAVIDNLWPLMVPGGIMIFDDYPYLLGAKKAVEESFPTNALQLCGQRYFVVKDEGAARVIRVPNAKRSNDHEESEANANA